MVGQPLLLGVLEGLLAGLGIEHAVVLAGLLTLIVYSRHLSQAGRLARNWLRVVMVASALLVVGLVLGIIPGLDLGRAVALGQGVVQFFMGLIQ